MITWALGVVVYSCVVKDLEPIIGVKREHTRH